MATLKPVGSTPADTRSASGSSATKSSNSWMIVSVILAIALIVSVGYTFKNKGDQISSDDAGQRLMSFVEEVYASQVGAVKLVGVQEVSGLYEVTVGVTVAGQPPEQKVYITKDGNLFIPQVLDINEITKQYRDFISQGGGAQVPLDGQTVPAGTVDDSANPEDLIAQ